MNTAKPRKPRAPGRAWALSGFLLGAIVSIGFNLQAAWLPADLPDTPADWAPSIPSQIGAIVWPVALMVSVEVLSRIAWPDGWGWKAMRALGIIAVAGGSGVISYGHIYAVLTAWGYGTLGAAVGPLVVDGLMLISGFALVSLGRAARAVPSIEQPDTVAEAPAEPVRTDLVRQPLLPPHPVDEPHAVSPAPPPDDATGETAPSPQPPARPAKPAAPAKPHPVKTATEDEISDDAVLAHIREHHNRENKWPSVYSLRNTLGLGQKRADRLLKEAAATRLELVKNEVSA